MSDTVLEPSSFSLPTGLVIPPGADIPHAWSEVIPIPPTGTPTLLTYAVQAIHYDIIYVMFVTFVSSSNAGNRTIALIAQDEINDEIMDIPAPKLQAASYIGPITWATSASTAYSVDNGVALLTQVAPLPLVLLKPGWTISVAVSPTGLGDTYARSSMTVVHIPTGTLGPSVDDSLVATPMVV